MESDELYPDFQTKSNKKYITKGKPAQKEEEKKEVAQKSSPKKEEKKEVVAEKKEETKPTVQVNPDEFRTYRFLKTAFPQKSSFKEWLVDSKFDHQEVIKSVEKIPGNESYALVTMKVKVYNKLNENYYNGVKIVFELQK